MPSVCPDATPSRLFHRLRTIAIGARRGMTLLEIMIVLAILALVMGLVIGPTIMEHHRKAQRDIATMAVHKLVDQAYPTWALAHPDRRCPDRLDELSEQSGSKDLKDPWGGAYKMYCGASLPPQAHGFAISSPGPDGKDGTEDDIKSWE